MLTFPGVRAVQVTCVVMNSGHWRWHKGRW